MENEKMLQSNLNLSLLYEYAVTYLQSKKTSSFVKLTTQGSYLSSSCKHHHCSGPK